MNEALWPEDGKEGLIPYDEMVRSHLIIYQHENNRFGRCYVMARCYVCAPNDSFTLSDACTGGPDRCIRVSRKEYAAWTKR